MLLDRAQEGNILTLLGSTHKQGAPARRIDPDHVDPSAALRSGAAVLCGAKVLVDMVAALVDRWGGSGITSLWPTLAVQEPSAGKSQPRWQRSCLIREAARAVPAGPVRAREECGARRLCRWRADARQERPLRQHHRHRLAVYQISDRHLIDAAGSLVWRAVHGRVPGRPAVGGASYESFPLSPKSGPSPCRGRMLSQKVHESPSDSVSRFASESPSTSLENINHQPRPPLGRTRPTGPARPRA